MARFTWGDILKTGAKVVLENLEDRARQEGERQEEERRGSSSGGRRPDPDPPPPPETTTGPKPGQNLDILVAPRGSEAHSKAEELADGQLVVAERKLWKAFERAAEHLSSQGPCNVTIRLAAGAYAGRMRTGTWLIPKIDAPGSSLHVLGGYGGAFVRRAPFTHRSELVVAEDRTAPVLQFTRNSRLDRCVISGLVIDCGPSNIYGDGDNLMTGQTG
ncbi:MAG: hypothetical protein MI919_33755, partial [Holophagales bacterium]|nr:hypothetical protein [Holophagales bacterium]